MIFLLHVLVWLITVEAKHNVIFLVTDGTGPAAINMARSFKQHLHQINDTDYDYLRYSNPWNEAQINDAHDIAGDPFEYLLTLDNYLIGTSRTRSSSSLITDSAAGATAFSCAIKTYNGAIAVDSNGDPCITILEKLKGKGFKTGLVVTTGIEDATPAAFNSHVHDRSQLEEIAEQQVGFNYRSKRDAITTNIFKAKGMIDDSDVLSQNFRKSFNEDAKIDNHIFGLDLQNEGNDDQINHFTPVTDLMIGGGSCFYLPAGPGSCRRDNVDLIKYAQAINFTTALNINEFNNWKLGKNVTLPALALLAPFNIPYELDRDSKIYPSIHDEVVTALTILNDATKNSENGFFLMIEGSRIDHAGHHNDPQASVREVLAYDKAFRAVRDFIDASDIPTVMLATSDHETGGLTVGLQVGKEYPEYKWDPEVLRRAQHSGEWIRQDLIKFLKPGITEGEIYGKVSEILNILGLKRNEIKKEEIIHLVNLLISNEIDTAVKKFKKLVSRQAYVGWTTEGHTAVDVNIYGYDGKWDILKDFKGAKENIQIGDFLNSLIDL
ncbi:alkaline phosphatase [Martiniozyma asiatica (nom. inval.)]|nr:alkaline phosphatase [Martiniozyma asiatica]